MRLQKQLSIITYDRFEVYLKDKYLFDNYTVALCRAVYNVDSELLTYGNNSVEKVSCHYDNTEGSWYMKVFITDVVLPIIDNEVILLQEQLSLLSEQPREVLRQVDSSDTYVVCPTDSLSDYSNHEVISLECEYDIDESKPYFTIEIESLITN